METDPLESGTIGFVDQWPTVQEQAVSMPLIWRVFLLLLLIVKVWFSVSPILLSPKSVLRSENERDYACFSLQQMGSNKSRQRA